MIDPIMNTAPNKDEVLSPYPRASHRTPATEPYVFAKPRTQEKVNTKIIAFVFFNTAKMLLYKSYFYVLIEELGGVGGFSLSRITTESQTAIPITAYQKSDCYMWCCAFILFSSPGSASAFTTKSTGKTKPTATPRG